VCVAAKVVQVPVQTGNRTKGKRFHRRRGENLLVVNPRSHNENQSPPRPIWSVQTRLVAENGAVIALEVAERARQRNAPVCAGQPAMCGCSGYAGKRNSPDRTVRGNSTSGRNVGIPVIAEARTLAWPAGSRISSHAFYGLSVQWAVVEASCRLAQATTTHVLCGGKR